MTTHYQHTTVLLHEAVAGLALREAGVYVDATFGGGGHSAEILKGIGTSGKLIAFDQDEDAWQNAPDDERLIPVRENFVYLKRFLRLHGVSEVDGILADLGVSSFQFDTPERGFSIRFDGPLDMRLDARMEKTAGDVVSSYSEQQLLQIFELYGEVRNAKQLSKQIVDNRRGSQIRTIAAFKALIDPAVKGNPNKYLAQVFQALRIEVNDELGVLKSFLQQCAQVLKPGGRLSIISFHSLEDRIVKQYVKRGGWDEQDDTLVAMLRPINAKPIVPTDEEQRRNNRSRSAKLRVAEKI
jgi:16S rRNA (cytosine1402-N4)-methyltransferase